MNVGDLKRLLADVPDDLDVVLEAVNFDDDRTAVDGATRIDIEDRGDGRALYIIGDDEDRRSVAAMAPLTAEEIARIAALPGGLEDWQPNGTIDKLGLR